MLGLHPLPREVVMRQGATLVVPGGFTELYCHPERSMLGAPQTWSVG